MTAPFCMYGWIAQKTLQYILNVPTSVATNVIVCCCPGARLNPRAS